jgi:hypothetical protein
MNPDYQADIVYRDQAIKAQDHKELLPFQILSLKGVLQIDLPIQS